MVGIKKLGMAALLLLWAGVATAAPDVGDAAPDFSLMGSDGKTWELAELRGQHVVIAFFPKAFTGG